MQLFTDQDVLDAVERALQTSTLSIGSAGPTVSNASALLAFNSINKGVLFPRMTTAQRNAIVNPKGGLVIYNTSTNKLNVYTSAAWEAITSA
jgi:hypothetical protein